MKLSIKAKRAMRHQARMKQVSKLSLVSLMDIFTILVFFLIVNSSSVDVLEADKHIKLPQSQSKQLAEDALVLLVNDRDIILQGKKVISIEQVLASEQETVAALGQELAYHKQREGIMDTEQRMGAITVMGDKKIEYSLLKKLLLTCAKAGFGHISLAVEQAPVNAEGVADVQSIN